MVVIITLYSSATCQNCGILEKILINKSVNFEKKDVNESGVIIPKEVTSVPILDVSGKFMTFPEAVQWINTEKREG